MYANTCSRSFLEKGQSWSFSGGWLRVAGFSGSMRRCTSKRACNATAWDMMSSSQGASACCLLLGLLLRDNTVVARWLRPVDHDQGCLLPADMRSWLPPDHLAWQVIEVTGQLDLSGFAAAYRADGQGQAPYDPAMMTALLLYCYFKGIRSSRKIAAACVDDLGCLVICGGAAPSHQAVATFIRRHRAGIKRLFVQLLSLLAAEGAGSGRRGPVREPGRRSAGGPDRRGASRDRRRGGGVAGRGRRGGPAAAVGR